MKRASFYLILILTSLTGNGQPKAFIRGIVKDRSTGESLIGANVLIGDAGTSTDVFGFFSLEKPQQDLVKIRVSYVGYKNYEALIDFKKNTGLLIEMEPGVDLDEINVWAVRRIEDRMEIGTIEIPVTQIKTLPLFGEPDVLKALQLMPGVQGGADGRNGFYVRGGSPDQNLFLLDGTPLYYVNHLGGFVSVFSPEILNNVKLYKGGFPARYGGRLSSIVDLRMKEGNKKEHHGSWGVGLISGDLTLEGPVDKKTSYIVSVRRMWIDLLMRPAFKIGTKHFTMGYNFYDFYGKISHQPNGNNRFYLSLYGGDDRLGYNYNLHKDQTKGYSKYLWGNVLVTARWNHLYNTKLHSDITLFYTHYRYKLNQYSRLENDKTRMIYKTGLREFGLKADFNWRLNNQMVLRYGGGFSGNWYNPGLMTNEEKSNSDKKTTKVGADNKINGISSFVYLENELSPFKQLTFNVGGRFAYLHIDQVNYLSLEPRLTARFEINGLGALKAGYSRMQQAVHMLSYSGNSFPTDIWLPSNKSIKPALSDQYSLAFVRGLANGKFEFSAETYYKEMNRLIAVKNGVTLVNTRQWDQNVEKDGTGTSKGIEFMAQKMLGQTTGWVSYTLAKSSQRFANINNGNAYAFKYDRRHSVSVVFNHKLSQKADFSATWVYGSGYPITLHTSTYQTIEPVDFPSGNGSFDVTGEAYLYPGKNWLRMRDYHRLDVGFNFHKQKGTKERIWTLGIYNVYNRQNAVFYYFEHKDQNRSNPLVLYQQSGFPVIPTVKYNIKF